MKEVRYFYAPDALSSQELPADEAAHAVRVLRLKEGDEIFLMDGCGSFHRAEVTMAQGKRCSYDIKETLPLLLSDISLPQSVDVAVCIYGNRLVIAVEEYCLSRFPSIKVTDLASGLRLQIDEEDAVFRCHRVGIGADLDPDGVAAPALNYRKMLFSRPV